MSTAATTVGTAVVEDRPVGLWSDAFRRMRRNPSAIIGGLLVVFFVAMAIFAPFIAPYDPTQGTLSDSHLPPSREHWFGTNVQGQDVYSRIIYGSRLTLGIATLSVIIGITIGATLGAISGFFRGWTDSVVMRGVDIMLSIPGLLFSIAVVTFLGQGVPQIALAIAIINIPIFARLLRGTLLSVREAEYVTAARAVGVGGRSLLVRHMLPNAVSPLIVAATLALATAVVDAAALGFLGLGPPDPSTPEWGMMLSDSYRYLNQAPFLAFFPGMAIVLSVLGFNLLGDALRDSLDPKLRR
jgi:peptide/nickel transport system permease protein